MVLFQLRDVVSIETEAKLRVASHDPIRRRLKEVGAASLGRVLENNEILDRPGGLLRRRGCGLRLRWTAAGASQGVSGLLTFKGPVLPSEVKKREELEISVSNVELTRQILRHLGFTRILYYQKWRESWRLDDCRVELDEPPHIGLFVEIEGPDESVILAVRAKLDLLSAPHENASYVRMLTDYCDTQGIADHTLLLDRDRTG